MILSLVIPLLFCRVRSPRATLALLLTRTIALKLDLCCCGYCSKRPSTRLTAWKLLILTYRWLFRMLRLLVVCYLSMTTICACNWNRPCRLLISYRSVLIVLMRWLTRKWRRVGFRIRILISGIILCRSLYALRSARNLYTLGTLSLPLRKGRWFTLKILSAGVGLWISETRLFACYGDGLNWRAPLLAHPW